mgnify:CR=1 FL=1
MGMFLRRGPAPKMGTPIGSLDVGATVKLNVSSTPWEFLVVHQGLPSSLYDASCDGTWLLLKDIYENRQWNSSKSTYATSTINTYLGGDFLAKFDSNVQNAIKQVKIPYCIGGGRGTVQSGANGLSCKVFLLSGHEVGFAGESYLPSDGAKLDYFNANTGTDSKRIAYLNGSAAVWWLRSPRTIDTSFVYCVGYDGKVRTNNVSYSFGIRPALILPSDFIVSEEMLAA